MRMLSERAIAVTWTEQLRLKPASNGTAGDATTALSQRRAARHARRGQHAGTLASMPRASDLAR